MTCYQQTPRRTRLPMSGLWRALGAAGAACSMLHAGEERMLGDVQRLVVGSPLETARHVHERLNKCTAMAVFSSDAMSSSAYATEEIVHHLAGVLGSAAYAYTAPVAGVITVVVVIT